MDFFSKIGSKVSDISKNVAQNSKDFVELNKLKSMITTEENNIQKAYTEIGKKFFEQNVGEVSAEFVENFNAINEAKAKIAELNAEITKIKGTYNCPNCGAEVATSQAFCPGCGTKLEKPAAETPAVEPTDTTNE